MAWTDSSLGRGGGGGGGEWGGRIRKNKGSLVTPLRPGYLVQLHSLYRRAELSQQNLVTAAKTNSDCYAASLSPWASASAERGLKLLATSGQRCARAPKHLGLPLEIKDGITSWHYRSGKIKNLS